jgi:diacylglycerol kinase (ATP)
VKRVFIINPKAGAGLGPRAVAQLEADFRERGACVDAVVCASRADTVERTRQALREGAGQIVAVGGDGTVNAVASAFFEDGKAISSEACLAVARAGSGSDYFRSLSLAAKHDWRDIVLTPVVRRVDVAFAETLPGTGAEPIFFLNMATLGMAAEVVQRKAAMSPWWPRSLRYLLPTVAGLFQVRPSRVRLTIDEQVHDREAICIMVAKGSFSGGGMRFGSRVTLDDGQFEVTLFQPMSTATMLLKTPRLYSGDFADVPQVEKFSGRRVQIEADPPFLVERDGDLIGRTNVVMRIVPRALPLCFPE